MHDMQTSLLKCSRFCLRLLQWPGLGSIGAEQARCLSMPEEPFVWPYPRLTPYTDHPGRCTALQEWWELCYGCRKPCNHSLRKINGTYLLLTYCRIIYSEALKSCNTMLKASLFDQNVSFDTLPSDLPSCLYSLSNCRIMILAYLL
jgi:hypothetical protein